MDNVYSPTKRFLQIEDQLAQVENITPRLKLYEEVDIAIDTGGALCDRSEHPDIPGSPTRGDSLNLSPSTTEILKRWSVASWHCSSSGQLQALYSH